MRLLGDSSPFVSHVFEHPVRETLTALHLGLLKGVDKDWSCILGTLFPSGGKGGYAHFPG